jgi:cytochrome bd-type quinol oxidase subunit 1
MKLATKEFDKLHEALVKTHKGPRAIHVVKSELMTGVFICSDIVSWVLVDRKGLDAAFKAANSA